MAAKVKTRATKNRIVDNGQKGGQEDVILIPRPNQVTVTFTVRGTTPYVQNKFSAKAKAEMKAKQEAGSVAKKGSKRSPKNFKECYEEAKYRPKTGGIPNGYIPTTHFRAAMISACRLVDFHMSAAKQCVEIEADCFDRDEYIPLLKITKGKPIYFEQAVRNESGVADIRARPMWEPGWECKVPVTYDADKFSVEDVTSLLMRAGSQVGIGEGRMASRKCVGLGWGAFVIVNV